MNPPLRRIVERGFNFGQAVETLECGHLHKPKPHPYYPDRHLEARRRRCQKCAAEQAGREAVVS